MSQKANFQEPFIRHFLEGGVSKKKKVKGWILVLFSISFASQHSKTIEKVTLDMYRKKECQKISLYQQNDRFFLL